MAVDTPVLERKTNEKNSERYVVPTRMDYMAEDEHNARIKDTYARLINPNNKIEDVFAANREPEREAAPAEPVAVRPYFVENARADAAIFRADSAINNRPAEPVAELEADTINYGEEEENEDLRPTPTTIQYQTIGKKEQTEISSTTDKRLFSLGKKEKIIVAVFVAVVVALITLVIINSAVISRLNADIATVQNSITTVRGALAGVNATMEEIIHNGLGH